MNQPKGWNELNPSGVEPHSRYCLKVNLNKATKAECAEIGELLASFGKKDGYIAEILKGGTFYALIPADVPAFKAALRLKSLERVVSVYR